MLFYFFLTEWIQHAEYLCEHSNGLRLRQYLDCFHEGTLQIVHKLHPLADPPLITHLTVEGDTSISCKQFRHTGTKSRCFYEQNCTLQENQSEVGWLGGWLYPNPPEFKPQV